MIEVFFSKLGHRLKKENHLSDVTWAVAEASPRFRYLFINFFFENITETSDISLIKREHSEDNCRPDFFVLADGKEYVIEAKIGDRNHHFDQYRQQFMNAEFGYITNYPLYENRPDYQIRRWSEFKNHLTKEFVHATDSPEKQLIQGYIKYLSNTCQLIEIKKMNLSNLTSLYDFTEMLKGIISSIDGHEASLYNNSKPCDTFRSGHYFTIKRGNSITITPWVGIYYCKNITVYIAVHESSERPVYKELLSKKIADGEHFENAGPDEDTYYGNTIWFPLKERLLKEFNQPETGLERQEAIIKGFINEVMNYIDLKEPEKYLLP